MSHKFFKRMVYSELLHWRRHESKDCALLIEGPKGVGKTTLVKKFAGNEYSSHLYIDFQRPRDGTIDIFEKYRSDSNRLFSNLESLYGVRLQKGKSLVIFDEIQHYPPARALIKYFVEEGDYSFIETGSLISIRQNVENIHIPSEESRIVMPPMTFEEFLWAMGDEVTMDLVGDAFRKREPLGRALHASIMEKFKTYLMVGGMPQAVSEYIVSGNLGEVEKVKRRILELYRTDMSKIKRGNGIHAAAMFEKTPQMLSRHRKIFSPGMVKRGSSTSDYETSAFWLSDSKICNLCREASDPNPAMNLLLDDASYKCYLADTGLLMTLAFDTGDLIRNDLRDAFRKGRLSMNEGMIFENAVAQMIVSEGSRLYFHEFRVNGDDRHAYEVDFMILRGQKVIPIEVKSATSSSHVSLDRFIEKHRRRVKDPVVIHPRDFRMADGIMYIPIYMTPFLIRSFKDE